MNASDSSHPIRQDASLAAPGLFRRLASGFYDALILLAIWILATFLIMPFTRSGELASLYAHSVSLKLLYQFGLLVLGYVFFGGFWTHGGQTIGMRTWKLRVLRSDGAPLDWYRALLRYLAMLIPWLLLLLGVEFLLLTAQQPGMLARGISAVLILLLALTGFLWPALNPRRLAWHDYFSGTRLLLLPKAGKPKQA